MCPTRAWNICIGVGKGVRGCGTWVRATRLRVCEVRERYNSCSVSLIAALSGSAHQPLLLYRCWLACRVRGTAVMASDSEYSPGQGDSASDEELPLRDENYDINAVNLSKSQARRLRIQSVGAPLVRRGPPLDGVQYTAVSQSPWNGATSAQGHFLALTLKLRTRCIRYVHLVVVHAGLIA